MYDLPLEAINNFKIAYLRASIIMELFTSRYLVISPTNRY